MAGQRRNDGWSEVLGDAAADSLSEGQEAPTMLHELPNLGAPVTSEPPKTTGRPRRAPAASTRRPVGATPPPSAGGVDSEAVTPRPTLVPAGPGRDKPSDPTRAAPPNSEARLTLPHPNDRGSVSHSDDSMAVLGSAGQMAALGSAGQMAALGSAGQMAALGSAGQMTALGSAGQMAALGSAGQMTALGSAGQMTALASDGHMNAASSDERFSTAGLVDRLNDSAPAPSVVEGAHTYRELYITIVVVAVLMISVIIYQFLPSNPVVPVVLPDTPKNDLAGTPTPGTTAPRDTTADGPPTPKPTPTPPAPPAPPAKQSKSTTAIPMLSVVTTPSGALVQINGIVYGKTPLIEPGPRDRTPLQVTLTKKGFRKFSSVLAPNEAGHFSLNVKLEPRN